MKVKEVVRMDMKLRRWLGRYLWPLLLLLTPRFVYAGSFLKIVTFIAVGFIAGALLGGIPLISTFVSIAGNGAFLNPLVINFFPIPIFFGGGGVGGGGGNGTISGTTAGNVTSSPAPQTCSNNTFGGIFETNISNIDGFCQAANPYTGSCSCPSGYSDVNAALITHQLTGGGSRIIHQCYKSGTLPVDYGGLYNTYSGSGIGTKCEVVNPYTNACSNAPGFLDDSSISIDNQTDDLFGPGQALTSIIDQDYVSTIATGAFGGLYEVNNLNGFCQAANPYTSTCSCPPNYSAYSQAVYIDNQTGDGGATISEGSVNIIQCYNSSPNTCSSSTPTPTSQSHPVVNAGNAYFPVIVGQSFTAYSGSATDASNQLTGYQWFLSSCPATCPTLSNPSGSLSGSSATIPGPTFTPTNGGPYILTLTVTDSAGLTGSGQVTETAYYPAPSISLNASPTNIVRGGYSTISWSTTRATSCYTGSSPADSTWNNATISLPGGSFTVRPGQTTQYILTCTSDGQWGALATANINITVAVPIWQEVIPRFFRLQNFLASIVNTFVR